MFLVECYSRDEKDNINYYEINVKVCVSDKFLSWVFGLGDEIEIISPETTIDKMKDLISKVSKKYGI